MAESSPRVVISNNHWYFFFAVYLWDLMTFSKSVHGSSPLVMIMTERDCDSAKRVCRERVRPEIQQSSASGTVRTVGVNQVRWLDWRLHFFNDVATHVSPQIISQFGSLTECDLLNLRLPAGTPVTTNWKGQQPLSLNFGFWLQSSYTTGWLLGGCGLGGFKNGCRCRRRPDQICEKMKTCFLCYLWKQL